MTTDDHNDKARERAEEMQMEATLTELGGIGPDRSLTHRILEALEGRTASHAIRAEPPC